MICANCNYNASDSFKFCPECGARLVNEPVESAGFPAEGSAPEIAGTVAEPEAETMEQLTEATAYEEAPEAHGELPEIAEADEGAAEPPVDKPVSDERAAEAPIYNNKPLNAVIVSLMALLTLALLAASLTLYFGYFDRYSATAVFSAAATETGSVKKTEPEKVEIENIYMPEKDIILFKGQSKRIKIDVYPHNAQTDGVLWVSEGEGVALSDDGRVTGMAEGGESVVTASYGGISDETRIRVFEREEAFFEAVEQITNREQHQKIDFSVQSASPSPLKPELIQLPESEARRKWGANLFARINEELPSYEAERVRLLNADTLNVIDCDVYRDKSDGKSERGDIRKIVAIERFKDYVEVADYYYLNGRVGFIFEKKETNYNPTPANWGTEGARLYFEDDALTTWRDVSQADERLGRAASFAKTDYSIGENGLEWNRTEYTYDFEANAVKNLKEVAPPADTGIDTERYKATEARALNEAYNIYGKIAEMPDTIRLSGYIAKRGGLPAKGAFVKFFSEQYGMLASQTVTKDDGTYSATVPRTEMPYTVFVSEPGFINAQIYSVDTSHAAGTQLPSVTLLADTSKYATARISLIDTGNGGAADENADSLASLSTLGCTLRLRRGLNNKEGEPEYTVILPPCVEPKEGDEAGTNADSLVVSGDLEARWLPAERVYEITMKSGNYTAELSIQGYEDAFFPLQASGGNGPAQARAVLVPKLMSDEVKILLSWDNPSLVLDSYLITPSGKRVMPAAAAESLETSGLRLETSTLRGLEKGTYTYYVADSAAAGNGDFSSKQMADYSATISVYTKNGLGAEFYAPKGENGVFWHAFNISGGNIVPVGRLYETEEDYKRLNAGIPNSG